MVALEPRDACIVAAVRTPMGAFQGSLSALSATQLGSVAVKAALERCGISPSRVQEVLLGNVVSANLGQAPASQASLGAGIPDSVPCSSINKVCASGIKAITLAAQSVRAGDNDIVLAGGMESMSNIPYYVPAARGGARLGHSELVDGMIRDGLWDPYSDCHMGQCAELCAERYGVTRQQQDAHAAASHARAQAAAAAGHTAREVVPVQVPGRGGRPGALVQEDEALSKMNVDKLGQLRPYFKKEGGTVTAGNASPITDGAAALVVASAAEAQRSSLPVLAVIRGYADAAQAPEWFSTAPALAVPKALERAGLSLDQIDYWEINEAFSVVDLVNQQLLGIPKDRVNVFGGSVALGHPIGASGANIVVRLINVLRTQGGRYGCAAICNGGGGATALVIEAVHEAQL